MRVCKRVCAATQPYTSEPLIWEGQFVFTDTAAHLLTTTHTEVYIYEHIQAYTQPDNHINTPTTIQNRIATQVDAQQHITKLTAWAYTCTRNPATPHPHPHNNLWQC